MPLPKPRKHEDKRSFISRCYADPNVRKDAKNDNNRIGGMCYSLWKRKVAKADLVIQAAGNEYISGANIDLTDDEIASINAEYYRPFDKNTAPSIYGPEGPKTQASADKLVEIKTKSPINMFEGTYDGKRYGYTLKLNQDEYTTEEGVNVDKDHAPTIKVRVKDHKAYNVIPGEAVMKLKEIKTTQPINMFDGTYDAKWYGNILETQNQKFDTEKNSPRDQIIQIRVKDRKAYQIVAQEDVKPQDEVIPL